MGLNSLMVVINTNDPPLFKTFVAGYSSITCFHITVNISICNNPKPGASVYYSLTTMIR